MKVKLRYTNAQQVEQYIEVFPIMDKPKLKYAKEKNQASHRIKFAGTLEFVNNEALGLMDYDIFYNYAAPCNHFEVEIYRDCGGEPWIGWFTIYMGSFDHDIKSFSVTPSPKDELYALELIWGKEFNLFEVQGKVQANAHVMLETEQFDYTYEIDPAIDPILITNGLPGLYYTVCNGGHFPKPTFGMAHDMINLIPNVLGEGPFPEYHTNKNWFISKMEGIYERLPNNNGGYGLFAAHKFTVTMKRVIAYTIKDDNGMDVSPDISDPLWIKECDIDSGGNPATKWTRAIVYEAMYYPPGAIPEELQLSYKFEYWNCQNADIWGNGCNYKLFVFEIGGHNVSYKHGRKLEDCVNFMLEGTDIKMQSIFFSSDELYVDKDPAILSPNMFRNLLVFNKRDTVRPDASNPSTLWKTTFQDFVDDLCLMFNLQWDVKDGKFIFEHLQFWENGGNPEGENNIAIDASVQFEKYLADTNKWKYNEQEFAANERFEFSEATSRDWWPVQFEYTGMCLGTETKKYTTKIIVTDLPMCQQYFQGNVEGIILLACSEPVDGIYTVMIGESPISHSSLSNGYLSWSFLLTKLFKHGRLLPIAKLSGKEIVFITTKRIKQQAEIQFPLCGASFDSSELIKTGLGNGLLNDGEEDLKTGIFTANLLHE